MQLDKKDVFLQLDKKDVFLSSKIILGNSKPSFDICALKSKITGMRETIILLCQCVKLTRIRIYLVQIWEYADYIKPALWCILRSAYGMSTFQFKHLLKNNQLLKMSIAKDYEIL